ncbi:MAG: hypothetical protein L6R37_005359 [Teloschistes peruensis]|nr:MAG: hypothetical protein L6R37_005359 [Teloschistes peruensis]
MPVEKRSTALHRPSKLREQRPAVQNTTTEHELFDLEAKRQELLGDFDWVGLEKMKPVKMKFADAEDRDLIGKRRRLATNHEEEHSPAPRRRRPVINALERLDMLRGKSSGLSSLEKISVHIGSSDHLFSQKNGSRHSLRKEHSHGSPLSETMLFQDRDSASGSIPRSASLQASLQQGLPSSEEMLFDRQWSYASLPPRVEPANFVGDSCWQPKHQPLRNDEDNRDVRTVHLISSGEESDNFTDFESVDEGFEHQQDQKLAPDEKDRFFLPRLPMPSVLPTSTRLNKLEEADQPTVGYEEGFENRLYKESTTKILPKDLKTESDRSHGDERANFAPATASKFAALSPANETCGPHELYDPEDKCVILDRREAQQKSKNTTILVTTETNKTAANRREDKVTQPLLSSRDPPAAIVQVKPTKNAPKSPKAAPVPPPHVVPIPIPHEGKAPAPATDRTPAEDELLWRKFVFGTTDPDDDWIFTQPLLNKPLKPASGQDGGLSSPLLPAFTQAARRERREDAEDTEQQSSPANKTQPSLLAEAASSSSSSSSTASPPHIAQSVIVDHQTRESSPARPQPLPSTIAGASVSTLASSPMDQKAVIGSPTWTQHSIQAHASTSSSAGSLGPARQGGPPMEAQRQPHALLQPPVIFTRPKRFVGESLAGAGPAPMRLGVSEAATRARKRQREEGDDGEYLERGKRKKGKEARDGLEAGVVAEMGDDERMVEDEIIDWLSGGE